MKNNKIIFTFKNLDEVINFTKNIDDHFSYKIQIILEIDNFGELYKKALPSYLYTSFDNFYEKTIRDYNSYIDEYDEKNSSIKSIELSFFIISDNESIISEKKIYLKNMYNNKTNKIYKLKLKIKNILLWIIKTLKI